MKHSIFKYMAIAAALLATAVNAGAQQYKTEGGVGTSKQVTGPDTNGDYTIKLETFATGTSTVTKTEKPVDVVLVLDVSGSMAEAMSYTARASQGYSYNSYGDQQLYYLYNGEYYPVERSLSNDYTPRRRLRFDIGNNNYRYLYGTSVQNYAPNNPRNDTDVIWTGVLYEPVSKMDALKTAVTSFIQTIQDNDLYIIERDENGNEISRTRRTNQSGDEVSLGNQISIVKFAYNTYNGSTSEATITSGNHYAHVRSTYTAGSYDYYYGYYNYSQTSSEIVYTDTWAEASQTGREGYDETIIIDIYYNCSEVLEGFTPTASNSNVTILKNAVTGMIAAGATASDYGLNLANLLLQGDDANPEANKVVVFFTDGSPTYSNSFESSVANKAITYAKTIKDSGASIFSIGVFDSKPTTNGDIWRYMNYVSSNFPNATGINTAGADGDATKNFYQDASDKDADLTAIFTAIAGSIGKSDATVGVSTQVRDVVTNSFVLPDKVSAADVHVYTSEATGSASGADDTNPAGWATPVEITSSVTKNIVSVDANGNPVEVDGDGNPTNPSAVKNKALFIEGFDYSLADSQGADGTTAHPYGNWVGPRYKNGDWIWAGKKLIITFKVKADPESTGGESLTNTGKSGVYIQNEDGTYDCINSYEQPHTTLSVNIKIRKTGLRHGESATFELMRIRPKGYNPNGATLKDKVANLEYNLIGKPLPDTHPATVTPDQPDMSDYYESMGWEGFKKVILTNKGADGAEVVKNILALDPYWVYMVLEDDWGWAYTMKGDTNQVGEDGTYTTSSVEVNPFRFHNTEEANAVKHAEAIMINHFQSSDSASYTEHTKSSKVESF